MPKDIYVITDNYSQYQIGLKVHWQPNLDHSGIWLHGIVMNYSRTEPLRLMIKIEESGETITTDYRYLDLHRKANRDDIIATIHTLWGKGWIVTSESVVEALDIGSHCSTTIETIEAVCAEFIRPGVKEQYMKPVPALERLKEEYLAAHPDERKYYKRRPWPQPIPDHWKHQQREQSLD